MGPANQPVSKTTQQQITPQQIPSKHPKFLNAIIGTFKDQRSYLEVSQSIGNVSAYHKWEKTLEVIKKSIPSHSLYLPVECEYEQQGLCGTAGILKLKFDYFPFLLDEQIANRQFNSLPFEQKELWFLLYILVQTAAATHSAGFCVGDIKPKNIFINETGDISVYSTFSFPEEFTNFQKVRYFKENNYLPPQGANDIQTGKEIPTYDQKLGESFSIGLTILDAIFLTDHSFLYDQMERFNEIAFKKIRDNLRNLQLNQKLKNIILQMLSMNPDKRLTCIEVYKYLAPYEKEIFELQNFEIKGDINSRKTISQKQQRSVQASPLGSEQKTSTIKSKRQNLVRYSLGKTDKRNKQQESTEKVDQDALNSKKNNQGSNQRNAESPQKQQQKQVPNYSVEASISSTLKKIQNGEQVSDKNLKPANGNTFQNINIESTGVRKNLTYVTETITTNQYHIEKPEFSKSIQTVQISNQGQELTPYLKAEQGRKDPQITFKTGNLFKRQRSSASILQSPNRDKPLNLGYENTKFQIPKPSTTYEYTHTYQRTQFRPSVDFTPLSTGSNDQYNDFLKQIDKQIEESKRMFPDSFK